MKKYCFLFCMLMLQSKATVTDSLQRLINGPGTVKQKQEWHHAITVIKAKTDVDGALQAAKAEYNFAVSNKLKRAQAEALFMFCRIYLQQKQLEAADSVINKADLISKELNDTLLNAQVFVYRGDIAYDRNEVAAALKHFINAFYLFEQKSFYKGMATTTNRQALVQFKQGNYEAALKNDKLSFKYASLTNDSNLMSNAVSNIGNYYYMNQQYDSALYYYEHTLLFINKNAKGKLALIQSNVGDVLVELNKHNEALPYFLEAKAASF